MYTGNEKKNAESLRSKKVKRQKEKKSQTTKKNINIFPNNHKKKIKRNEIKTTKAILITMIISITMSITT